MKFRTDIHDSQSKNLTCFDDPLTVYLAQSSGQTFINLSCTLCLNHRRYNGRSSCYVTRWFVDHFEASGLDFGRRHLGFLEIVRPANAICHSH